MDPLHAGVHPLQRLHWRHFRRLPRWVQSEELTHENGNQHSRATAGVQSAHTAELHIRSLGHNQCEHGIGAEQGCPNPSAEPTQENTRDSLRICQIITPFVALKPAAGSFPRPLHYADQHDAENADAHQHSNKGKGTQDEGNVLNLIAQIGS